MNDFVKIYLEKQEFVNNAFISLYYDGEFKKLHLFDLDLDGSRSLTNAICMNSLAILQNELFQDHNFSIRIGECDIYLYGTDGLISEYIPSEEIYGSGEFKHVKSSDQHLYAPFVRQSADRWHEQHPTLF